MTTSLVASASRRRRDVLGFSEQPHGTGVDPAGNHLAAIPVPSLATIFGGAGESPAMAPGQTVVPVDTDAAAVIVRPQCIAEV
jgi:hypothetical protein